MPPHEPSASWCDRIHASARRMARLRRGFQRRRSYGRSSWSATQKRPCQLTTRGGRGGR